MAGNQLHINRVRSEIAGFTSTGKGILQEMKELIATGDPVLLSALKVHLSAEGISFDIFGAYMGSLFPGDLNIATTRVVVADEDFESAEDVLNRLKNGEMALDGED